MLDKLKKKTKLSTELRTTPSTVYIIEIIHMTSEADMNFQYMKQKDKHDTMFIVKYS